MHCNILQLESPPYRSTAVVANTLAALLHLCGLKAAILELPLFGWAQFFLLVVMWWRLMAVRMLDTA